MALSQKQQVSVTSKMRRAGVDALEGFSPDYSRDGVNVVVSVD